MFLFLDLEGHKSDLFSYMTLTFLLLFFFCELSHLLPYQWLSAHKDFMVRHRKTLNSESYSVRRGQKQEAQQKRTGWEKY